MHWQWAPDAKYWHRLRSVQLLILGAVFSGVASVLGVFGGLQIVQDHPWAFLVIAAIVNIGALAGRLVDQPSIPNE